MLGVADALLSARQGDTQLPSGCVARACSLWKGCVARACSLWKVPFFKTAFVMALMNVVVGVMFLVFAHGCEVQGTAYCIQLSFGLMFFCLCHGHNLNSLNCCTYLTCKRFRGISGVIAATLIVIGTVYLGDIQLQHCGMLYHSFVISVFLIIMSPTPLLFTSWQYATYLTEREIRWVKLGALRKWNLVRANTPESSLGRFKKMQNLEEDEYVCFKENGDSPRQVLFRLLRSRWLCCGVAKMFVVSHPWLAKEHPDPKGMHLRELVQELEWADDRDLVFVDYCSIRQKEYFSQEEDPAREGEEKTRSEEEKREFKSCLKGMNMMYSSLLSSVVILPGGASASL